MLPAKRGYDERTLTADLLQAFSLMVWTHLIDIRQAAYRWIRLLFPDKYISVAYQDNCRYHTLGTVSTHPIATRAPHTCPPHLQMTTLAPPLMVVVKLISITELPYKNENPFWKRVLCVSPPTSDLASLMYSRCVKNNQILLEQHLHTTWQYCDRNYMVFFNLLFFRPPKACFSHRLAFYHRSLSHP